MSLNLSSKSLKNTDIEDRFNVVKTWRLENWPDENWAEIKDSNRKIPLEVVHQVTKDMKKGYVFVLTTRGDGSKRTVFDLMGWKEFVKDNNLRVGDVVHFGKKEGENHYTIMVERKYL